MTHLGGVARFALLLSMLWSAAAAAQTGVSIRPEPKPGEVIQVTTSLEIEIRGGERAHEPGPAMIALKGRLIYSQANTSFDAQDRMEAQITIERLEFEEILGGKTRPPSVDYPKASDRVVVAVFDRAGKLVSTKVPSDMRSVAATLTQLLAATYGVMSYLPPAVLAVGESVSTESELPFRLPSALVEGPLKARTKITLRELGQSGAERTAQLDQTIDLTADASRLSLSGGGAITINLDRGFVTASETAWYVSGVMPQATGQSIPVHASIKTAVAAK